MSGFSSVSLVASITRAASRQTFLIIRFLADRDRVDDAYRAYAYFRWLDDQLDRDGRDRADRLALAASQRALLERCLRGDIPRLDGLRAEERMLAELVAAYQDRMAGLDTYLRFLMAVMAFDAERRGRLISAFELARYTQWLAVGVTESMRFFIGSDSRFPRDPASHLAVAGAHVTHMLRDAVEDARAGYFNIPLETMRAYRIDPFDAGSDGYRRWTRERVELARRCFQSGRAYLSRVENARFRLAALGYTARFERTLATIEQDGFRLRPVYPEPKLLGVLLRAMSEVFSRAASRGTARPAPAAVDGRSPVETFK